MAAVRHFEGRYCVADGALPPSYVAARADWFATAATFAGAFGLSDEALHDSVLLLDRAVAAGGEELLSMNAAALVVACLVIAARQAGEQSDRLPAPAQLEAATGLPGAAAEAAQAAVRTVLQGDTSAISGVRVLKLLLERLGADFGHPQGLSSVAGPALLLVRHAASQPGLRELRPTAFASAVLLASRKSAGASQCLRAAAWAAACLPLFCRAMPTTHLPPRRLPPCCLQASRPSGPTLSCPSPAPPTSRALSCRSPAPA